MISYLESFKARYGLQSHEIVADSGYGSQENYEYMFSNGMTPYVKYNMFHIEQRRRYIFMDEPTNGLDIPSKAQFRKALMQFTSDDSTVVISTHQVKDLENVIDPVIILDRQDVLLNASVSEISEKLWFDYGTEINPNALYSEVVPGGCIQVLPNPDGRDSKVNIEALFNAVHKNKDWFKAVFTSSTSK